MAAYTGYSLDTELYGANDSASRKRRVIELLQRLLDAFRSQTHVATVALPPVEDENMRQMTFTFSAIALCAKLARIDGAVTKEEFLSFREVFPMQDSLSDKIRKLFVMACDDGTDYMVHAERIATLFPKGSRILRQLLDRLCVIANADRVIGQAEEIFLRRVALALGFGRIEFSQILRRHVTPAPFNPYQILGISSNISNTGLKEKYRALMQKHHPDRLGLQGASAEVIELANRKVAQINESYHQILRVRGLK